MRFAEANTSAGAPFLICVARTSEPAKFNETAIPVFLLNAGAAAVNASRNEPAAYTMSEPPVAARAESNDPAR
jgi:hypothetical protein